MDQRSIVNKTPDNSNYERSTIKRLDKGFNLLTPHKD